MSIEKCINFKREVTEGGKAETQFCRAKKIPVECGGFSDFCTFPVFFVADRFVMRSDITFPQKPRPKPKPY